MSIAYTEATSDFRVRRHCEALARHGWGVFQVGLGNPGDARVTRSNGVVYIRYLVERYRGGNLIRYAWAYLGFLLWARWVIKRLIQSQRVAVVQANNIPNFIVLAAKPARQVGAALILDIHDPVPELFLSKFSRWPGSRIVARLAQVEERLCARAADLVLCVNSPHRDLTISHGVAPEKLRVVVNAADGILFPRQPTREPHPFISYHGTVTARMGLDVVLQAIPILRSSWPELKAAIWGDGDVVKMLQALRDELGLNGVVEIPGRRYMPSELLRRLCQAGIGIVPLRRDSFIDCALPTKLIENVRLGIPSVVTWTPTIAEHFPEDTVYYVREFSPACVADVVQDALLHPDEARERAARAQALPIARSWQEIEEDYVDIVVEASRNGRGRE